MIEIEHDFWEYDKYAVICPDCKWRGLRCKANSLRPCPKCGYEYPISQHQYQQEKAARRPSFSCLICQEKVAVENFEAHVSECEKLQRLRGKAKKVPSMVVQMPAAKFDAIEREQAGRLGGSGAKGSYFYLSVQHRDHIQG